MVINDSDKVILTPLALEKVKEFMAGNGGILRLLVQGGGCNGVQPKVALDILHEGDAVYSQEDVSIAIDGPSVPYLKGSTLDYVHEMMGAGFRFINNPNSISQCGCGSSFRIAETNSCESAL